VAGRADAFAFFTEIFGIMYGSTTYRFRLPGQSVLKWLTMPASTAGASRLNGHKITTSHY